MPEILREVFELVLAQRVPQHPGAQHSVSVGVGLSFAHGCLRCISVGALPGAPAAQQTGVWGPARPPGARGDAGDSRDEGTAGRVPPKL